LGSTDIAAYYYGEKTVCSECTKDLAVPYYLIDHPDALTTEQVLDQAAQTVGIKRYDEDRKAIQNSVDHGFRAGVILGQAGS
jgi:hypothetical protein